MPRTIIKWMLIVFVAVMVSLIIFGVYSNGRHPAEGRQESKYQMDFDGFDFVIPL